jgi:hypothetical protein
LDVRSVFVAVVAVFATRRALGPVVNGSINFPEVSASIAGFDGDNDAETGAIVANVNSRIMTMMVIIVVVIVLGFINLLPGIEVLLQKDDNDKEDMM